MLVIAEIVGTGVVKGAVGEPHGVTPNCVWEEGKTGVSSPLPHHHRSSWLLETFSPGSDSALPPAGYPQVPHVPPACCPRHAHPHCWAASPGRGRGTGRTPGSSSLHLWVRSRSCSGTLPCLTSPPAHHSSPQPIPTAPDLSLADATNLETPRSHPPPKNWPPLGVCTKPLLLAQGPCLYPCVCHHSYLCFPLPTVGVHGPHWMFVVPPPTPALQCHTGPAPTNPVGLQKLPQT